MIRLALKMTLARKGRLVLTALAVILGTSFLSGTFIFRDTINKTFDELFSDVFRDVDAYVRSTNFIETNFGGEQRSPVPISLRDEVLKFMRQAVDELGQTIVMVTHDAVAASFADRIVFLADGRLAGELREPTPERVLDRLKNLGN